MWTNTLLRDTLYKTIWRKVRLNLKSAAPKAGYPRVHHMLSVRQNEQHNSFKKTFLWEPMTYKISVMYLVPICSITIVALRCTFTKCERVIQEERHQATTSVQVYKVCKWI